MDLMQIRDDESIIMEVGKDMDSLLAVLGNLEQG